MRRKSCLSLLPPWWSIAPRLAAVLVLAVPVLAGGREARAAELVVFAAGATESTMRDTVGTFEKESGWTVKLSYGAVGALRDKLYAGQPADLTIVTPAVIEQLAAKGYVRRDASVALGQVGGGIAVRRGAPRPAVATPEEFKRALLAAKEVYYADPATATAGAYFMKVADSLGVGDAVRAKGHSAPGGKEAMRLMAKSRAGAIGVTQISEILSVPEVVLIGPYPGSLQRITTYTAIPLIRAKHPEAAQAFLRFLTSPSVLARFKRAGFEPPR
ncbi:MAG: molybdate ABC transporter substrate-binding protein [Burkholderiales bacterium]